MHPDPLWYKDAIFYELHVRTFYDSNGDGVGDFPGATQKLDYLQDLGITCVWLLPFYQSPLKDDGYDVADYFHVHPAYGTLQDFRTFVAAAHNRGIRVIADLVLNHTSDQHLWFREARSSPASPKRDYYVWSDSDQKYKDARIIFHQSERSNWTYDPVARAYYWHRFFSHQPDLNYDNPEVQREMLAIMRFWLDHGLDGFRCDAVPHLFERDGTSCENLPETHAYIKALRQEIDRCYPGCILLSEANQSLADLCSYFGDGDEFHLAFHFPLVPRLFLALAQQERVPLVDLFVHLPRIPESCQWAPFIRNHDELTLSRLTAEEREQLIRAYAHIPRAQLHSGIRRRLAPMLGNDLRQLELVHSILFTIPGSPVLYYGDEIGMGDNLALHDRYGLRTPMQWSSDQNAGFSQAEPEQLYLPVIRDPLYSYEVVNVAAQLLRETSLLRRVQTLIHTRRRYAVFGQGSLEILYPANPHILAYLRQDTTETVLIVHNLSVTVQPIELDLARFREHTPMEMFGNIAFPKIDERPYFLSLGPYGFSWFRLIRGGYE